MRNDDGYKADLARLGPQKLAQLRAEILFYEENLTDKALCARFGVNRAELWLVWIEVRLRDFLKRLFSRR